ncbi:unnamed protein product [Lymnaea stagnalis]|uniref:C2H2-type domain-containing protein n=1 Tax=Lymnaea stagnalis TaxID=6523 RepID=A0AAV2HSH6_LYMST
MDIEGLDPSLLKCVRQVLDDVERKRLLAGNKADGEEDEKQTMYIIDLDTLGRASVTTTTTETHYMTSYTDTKPSLSPASLNDSISPSTSSAMILPKHLDPKLTKESTGDQSGTSLPTALDLECQGHIEISFVSCVTELDDPMNESQVGSSSSSQVQHVHKTDIEDDVSCTSSNNQLGEDLSKSSQHVSLHKLASSEQNVNTNISHSVNSNSFLGSRIKTLPFEASQMTSSGEHLLTMAQKIIEENSNSKRLLSIGNMSPAEVKEEKIGSDSVITMYLSSPSELKEKINSLKTDSPIIVMQAGQKSIKDVTENDARQSSYSSDSAKFGDIVSELSNASEGLTATLPLSSDVVVYRCLECGYSSHNKHYYKQHVDLVHNADRPYKCPHCDYAGKRRHALLEHMVVHSNQRPFTCDHCNASFRKKGHLTNHIKLHTSQKLVHCGVCNIQLPDTEAFEAHLHRIHNTDKLYKCKLCDHTVVNREAMLKHLQAHNEAIIYSCPKCSCLLSSDESLISHMKNAHDFLLVERPPVRQNVGVSSNSCAAAQEKAPKLCPTNIMCSVCGFVCCNNEMMQKHMWEIHINVEDKQAAQAHSSIKINPGTLKVDSGATSTMGVLKMNVDLGQKTLPKNVVYQCTSCSFTSSDNSVFIKHMLAHKTQEKQQQRVTSALEPNQDQKLNLADTKFCSSLGTKPTTPASQDQGSDSSVPFYYDKAASRFRCVICGYHCEFQRTIKAHIWKHSGHQNIEYPTFDQSSGGKAKPFSSVVQVFPSLGNSRRSDEVQITSDNDHCKIRSHASNQPLQIVQTRSGETVQLVPVNPFKTKYSPGEIIQIKDNSIILPAAFGRTSAASRLLENIAFSAAHAEHSTAKVSSQVLVSPYELKSFASTTEKSELEAPQPVKVYDLKPVSLAKFDSARCSNVDGIEDVYSSLVSLKAELNDGESLSSTEVDEGCTEPSVVVEVMDTVLSESDLTGMASQHGSPRISDLEGSGESKFLKASREIHKLCESDQSLGDDNSLVIDEVTEVAASDPINNHHSYSVLLRCPMCDRQLREDFKSHLLTCQRRRDQEHAKAHAESLKENMSGNKTAGRFDADLHTEDTDSTESSDELTLSGDSGAFSSQQKSGICSSLLAVIEQLRERSRSESEEDRQGSTLLKRSSKKKVRQEDEMDMESIDELRNIEKISDSGCEKFRCSLCHYTSQRICNIKIHMKTHRQKKPSECSLCDFSSTSSEVLQDHMLKHCKVRTYACKFCPQSFNHKSTLRAHLRAHKDQEPFLCAYCVFETTNPIEYREHMQVHSGCSSRLRCPGCDVILNNKEELTVHLLKCKGSSKKTKSLVSVDEKSAVDREIEKLDEQISASHITTHHACVVSGCTFTSTSIVRLQDHLSIHCNPALLVCNLCDFKALNTRSLKSHMKRHSNDQRYVQQPLEQYKCNLCGYVCHHLPSLKSHMWRHASDQSYSYEFTNDVINAAIDHDTRVEADGEPDDPELLDRVINSERKILEGELTKCNKGDGQRPICWVTFRCCSCGFETINKAKLNIHMRSHSDIIQQALDLQRKSQPAVKSYNSKRLNTFDRSDVRSCKAARLEEIV